MVLLCCRVDACYTGCTGLFRRPLTDVRVRFVTGLSASLEIEKLAERFPLADLCVQFSLNIRDPRKFSPSFYYKSITNRRVYSEETLEIDKIRII